MPLEASTSLKEVLLWRHNHRKLTTFGNMSGLSLAIQLGCQQLDVKLNAKVIVDLINSDTNPNRAYSPLLYDCRTLLARLPQAWVI